jgi:hypothetical protein
MDNYIVWAERDGAGWYLETAKPTLADAREECHAIAEMSHGQENTMITELLPDGDGPVILWRKSPTCAYWTQEDDVTNWADALPRADWLKERGLETLITSGPVHTDQTFQFLSLTPRARAASARDQHVVTSNDHGDWPVRLTVTVVDIGTATITLSTAEARLIASEMLRQADCADGGDTKAISLDTWPMFARAKVGTA